MFQLERDHLGVHSGRPARPSRPGAAVLGSLLLLVCLTVATPVLGAPGEARALLRPASPPGREMRHRPEVTSESFARLDPERLADSRLRLDLAPGLSVVAQRRRTESNGFGSEIWVGGIEGNRGSAVFATVRGVTLGNVRVGNRQFEIRDAGEGLSVIQEIDQSRLPDERCEEDDGILEPVFETGSATEAVESDPCNIIDIMVLYTPAVLNAYGSPEAVEALIHLAISESNLSYERSGVTSRLTPVYIGEVDYQEAFLSDNENGDVFDDRDFMIDPGDNVLDEVPVLRDRYCADMVMLITHYGGEWCGGATVMANAPDPSHESKAYGVTVDDCATGKYTFAHEFAHIQGARHDWYVDDKDTPYTYGHGYVNTQQRWRTIMAYNTECDDQNFFCPRQGFWSNPGDFHQGQPTGVPESTSTSCTAGNVNNGDCDAENWRVLNNTDCTVANFRDRSQCIPSASRNVWMKDAWADTGQEPDPWTFGADMWESPYIWVRNSPDLTGAKQHLHQIPEAGNTNYVYVKLHNDFDVAASGQLKLYYAEASMFLSWPADWTMFADDAVGIAAHATLLTPATWVPPDTKSYALMARWDSPTAPADPMAVPEGFSAQVNARNNNNVILRNVHTVNLIPDFAAELPTVKMPNPDPGPGTFDLTIELPDDPDNFLAAGGEILLDLGGLLDNWQSAGGRGDGVQLITDPTYGDVLQVQSTSSATSSLLGIPMAAGESEPIRLILTAPFVPPPPPLPPIPDDPAEPDPTGGDQAIPDQPLGVFWVEMAMHENGERIGGVAYEIHVDQGEGSGMVPDGKTLPGTPLLVDRDGTDLELSWSASCSPADVDYAVYEGTLGDFTSHFPVVCSTGGATAATVPMPTGGAYYLVVPSDTLTDGSYGRDSSGVERPGSLAGCRPHAVSSCTP